MKGKSESDVAQSCPTPLDPVDCSLPGSSVHGIFQAKVLEWGAIDSDRIYRKNSFLGTESKFYFGQVQLEIAAGYPVIS